MAPIRETQAETVSRFKKLTDGGRPMYHPAEWGPRTRATTLLGDSAPTTWRAGLGCAHKGSLVDQDERLQLEARISRDLNRPPSL